jgi:hypothetical protein
MKIEGTTFGTITIDGTTYEHEVIVRLSGKVYIEIEARPCAVKIEECGAARSPRCMRLPPCHGNLEGRLAKGEIDSAEFQEKRRLISE